MRFTAHCPRHCIKIALMLNRVRTAAKLILAIAFGSNFLMAVPAQAQGTVRTSAPPSEYVPFEVVVQTNNSYCHDATFPIFGDVQYSGGTLSVVLTHLTSPLLRTTPTTCGRERRFTLAGLPRGRQTIKIDVTDLGASANGGPGARVSETITTSIDVTPFSTTASLANFWTGISRPALSDGPWGFVLTPSRGAIFIGQWDWLEVGDALTSYTFKAYAHDAADRLPDALVGLIYVAYPAPYGGTFVTTDRATAQRLAAEWNKPMTETLFAVGRVARGACPIGMSPVYQAFHPQAVSHRWTQSRTAYATLLANGYQGDGVSWCAPALRGE